MHPTAIRERRVSRGNSSRCACTTSGRPQAAATDAGLLSRRVVLGAGAVLLPGARLPFGSGEAAFLPGVGMAHAAELPLVPKVEIAQGLSISKVL